MKPKPSPSLPKQRAKRPKAVALPLGIDSVDDWCIGRHSSFSVKKLYCAVLPTRTQQQARQLVRWHDKTYAQKVGELAEALAKYAYSTRVEDYHGEAKCILNLLGESPDPEN